MRSLASRVLRARLARWAASRRVDTPPALLETVISRWTVLPALTRVGVLTVMTLSLPLPFGSAASLWSRLPIPGVADRWLDVTACASWTEFTCSQRGVDVRG